MKIRKSSPGNLKLFLSGITVNPSPPLELLFFQERIFTIPNGKAVV